MRWRILRALAHKELLRFAANRGSLALVGLLLVAALLLSFFGQRGPGGGGALAPAVQLCYVDYAADGPLLDHLRAAVPPELTRHVRFRRLADAPTDADGRITYPQNTGAIQLRPDKVWFWHPGGDPAALSAYELWFWREAAAFAQRHAGAPPLAAEYSTLNEGLDPRAGIATSLVLFGLFFVCVYLMPSMTCEERERGVLLAQALSPARTSEILAGKFLVYPALGLALAAVLAGTYQPRALLLPFFWLGLGVCVLGSMGVGLVIASVARTQRAASMGAMGYLGAVSLLLFICQANNIPGLPALALEYHGPRVIHAALTATVRWYHWVNLCGALLLGLAWSAAAGVIFRRQGWQ